MCRTDLHVLDGELADPKLPLVLGHEIVGTVVEKGSEVDRFAIGDRVGVPWLGWTCGVCEYCRGGRENLCDRARFTGYQIDGGYAELTVADQRYCFAIDPPLRRCRGGAADVRRADRLPHACAWPARRTGSASTGLAPPPISSPRLRATRAGGIFAFTRPGDSSAQDFARRLGAEWAGDSTMPPPEPLDAALIFAPVGALVPAALAATKKGGTVVCGGIHMSDIPSFPYGILWEERVLRSVANLTRRDAEEFLALAPQAGMQDRNHPLPAGSGERSACRPAQWRVAGCCRAGALTRGGSAALDPAPRLRDRQLPDPNNGQPCSSRFSLNCARPRSRSRCANT